MGRGLKILIVVLALGAAGAAALYLWEDAHRPALPPQPVASKPEPPKAAGPKFPLADEGAPLPALGASDPAAHDALGTLFGVAAIDRFFHVEDFVRRIVATIDNLPREKYAARLNPLKATPGLPRTAGKNESLVLAPDNSARYVPFIALVEQADTAKVAAAYRRFYPLFQQAYRELGYPEGHFNDRLVEVIDHLLATPDVKGPIRLTAPHVLYEFADPELEALSSGQKAMIRIGAANAAKLKAKLRELRAAITSAVPGHS